MNTGRKLLKYSGPTAHALQNFEKSQIFCQHFAAYNDPFEFWTRISSGIPDPGREPERYLAALRAWGFDCRTVEQARDIPAIQDNLEEYFDECQHYAPPFEEMKREMRISCFSSEADNLLMWSHYGDGLRGFCIEFDEDAITGEDGHGHVLDVAYLDSPPQVDSFVYGVAWDQDWYSQVAIGETEAKMRYQGSKDLQGDIAMYEEDGAEALQTMREIWQHVFAVKPSEWKYERERRLLVQSGRQDTAPVLRDYDRSAVKGVILGERMPEEFRACLLAAVREHYPDIPVKTASRAPDAFRISISPR